MMDIMPADEDLLPLPFVHHLTHLDACIPTKVQRGLSTVDLCFTCIDVTHNYFAIGTSIGIAYLFDRRNGELQKLYGEGSMQHSVTYVKCLETLDLMVAVGTSAGTITIFQVPLHLNRQLPDSSNQLERYLINGVHFHPITCLEWSRNGMKLFSGDENGYLAQTDVDFTMHLCKSSVLLQEDYGIVQIVYEQRMLLISTKYRTILSSANDQTQIKQLGQKERKSLGNFGACFCTLPEKPNDVFILASRPALRLWKASLDGTVLETFIFKDCNLKTHQILSLSSASRNSPPKSETQFGILRNFSDQYILTFNSTKLYFLTIEEPTIAKKCEGLGAIFSVASHNDEILVLSGPRSIIRISCTMDHTISQQNNLIKEESFLPSLKFMPNALKDLEYKLKGSNLMTTSIFGIIKPRFSPFLKEQSTVDSSENLETCDANTEPLSIEWLGASGSKETSENDSKLVNEEHVGIIRESAQDNIGISDSNLWPPLSDSDDMDDKGAGIVFKQHTRKGHSAKRRSANPFQLQQRDIVDVDLINADLTTVILETADSKLNYQNENSTPAANVTVAPIASDTITPSNDREQKEILLAQMLNIKELLPEDFQHQKQNVDDTFSILGFQKASNAYTKSEQEESTLNIYNPPLDLEETNSGLQVKAEENPTSSSATSCQPNSLEFDIYRSNYSNSINDEEEDISSQLNSEANSYLSYGPPSGSSNMASMNSIPVRFLDHPLKASSLTLPYATTKTSPLVPILTSSSDEGTSQSLPPNLATNATPVKRPQTDAEISYGDFWVQHKPPGHIRSLAVCEHYIVCTDAKETVHFSSFKGLGLDWHETKYQANQISVSSCGKRVWRIHRNSAYALVEPSTDGPFGKKWIEVDLNIKNISVAETCIWYVNQGGDVFAHTNLKDDQVFGQPKPAPYLSKIAQVTSNDTSVWAVSVDQTLLCRVGITSENWLGIEWSRVSFEAGSILSVALGCQGTVWIIDDALNVWFKTGLTPKLSPHGIDNKWWQVQIGDYIYQNMSTLQNLTSTLAVSFKSEQLASILSKGGPCLVSSKLRGTWIYNAQNHQLFTNQSEILGHHWTNISCAKIIPNKRNMMSASGVYRHHGGVFVWQPGCEISCLTPTSNRCIMVKLPESFYKGDVLQCMSAAPESLWLLTESGKIFIRNDITATNPAGRSWVELDLAQIVNHRLVHISCGPNLVWACDNKGVILMRIGSLQAPSKHNFPAAWVIVEDTTLAAQQSSFAKVFVGPLDYTVWAIDNKNNVFVREGIFPELPIGLGWVPVSGVQATQLAISEQAVYALTPNKTIYKRFNISRNNYIGDYWMELPGQAEQLSVTVDDKLWALNPQHQLVQHENYTIFGGGKIKDAQGSSSKEDKRHYSSNEEDWEMIN